MDFKLKDTSLLDNGNLKSNQAKVIPHSFIEILSCLYDTEYLTGELSFISI